VPHVWLRRILRCWSCLAVLTYMNRSGRGTVWGAYLFEFVYPWVSTTVWFSLWTCHIYCSCLNPCLCGGNVMLLQTCLYGGTGARTHPLDMVVTVTGTTPKCLLCWRVCASVQWDYIFCIFCKTLRSPATTRSDPQLGLQEIFCGQSAVCGKIWWTLCLFLLLVVGTLEHWHYSYDSVWVAQEL
jgi:hypothetical protein